MIGIKHNDGAGFFPLGRVNESAVVLASSRSLRMGEDAGFKIATTREAMTKLPFPIRIRLSFAYLPLTPDFGPAHGIFQARSYNRRQSQTRKNPALYSRTY